MKWCLECHRAPQKYVRTPDKIYDMTWLAAKDQPDQSEQLITRYHVDTSGRLTNCSTCHR
jgi:hypothetical protein